MAESDWRTAFKAQRDVAPPEPQAPPPPAPSGGGSWRTAFAAQPALAPAPAPQAPSPSGGVTGAPAFSPPTVTLADGLKMPAVMTTAPKDVTAETMLLMPTGVAGEGPGAAQGAPGVDQGATAKAIGLERAMADIRQRKAAGEVLTPVQEKELEAKAYLRARGEVSEWYQKYAQEDEGAYPLLDISPSQAGISYWLEGGSQYDGVLDAIPLEVREAVGPFLGMKAGTSVTATTAQGTKSYNEGLGWGGMDWGGRLSLFTMMSNYYAADGTMDWGGPGHMEGVARGEDLFSQWDQLEALSTRKDITKGEGLWAEASTRNRQALGWALRGLSNIVSLPVRSTDRALETLGIVDEDTLTSEGAEKFGDFAMTAGLTLVDPDIWGGLGGSAAKGVRMGADRLSSMRNLKKAQAFEDAAVEVLSLLNAKHFDWSRPQANVEAGKVVEDALRAIEKKAGVGARYMLEAFTAANLSKEGTASEATAKSLAAMSGTGATRAKLMEDVALDKAASKQALEEVATWLGTGPTAATIDKAIAATSRQMDRLASLGGDAAKDLERAQAGQKLAQASGKLDAVQTWSQAAAKASQRIEEVNKTGAHVSKLHGEHILKRNLLKEARASKNRRKVPQRLQAMVDYRDAAMKHLGIASLHADMDAMHKTMKMLTKGRKVDASPELLEKLKTGLRQAAVAVAEAENPVTRREALHSMNALQIEAAAQGGSAITETMGRGVRILAEAELDARATMSALGAKGERAGHFTREALGAGKHAETVKALERAAASSVGARGLMGVSVALQRLGRLYKDASDVGLKALPEVDQALMRQLGRSDLEHLDASPNRSWAWFQKGFEGLRRFADPMRATAGTTDPEVQQILKGGMNVIDLGTVEMARLAKGATKAGQRAKRFVQYLDSAEEGTVLQSSSSTTLWGEALNTLRRLAGSDTDEASSGVMDVLARMWLPKGERSPATIKKLADSARKYLVDQPDASFADFAQHMQMRTARVILGEAVSTPGALSRKMAEMSLDADRSVALATQGILHAVALDRVASDLALYAAKLPPAAVDAMVALSSQDPRRAGEYIEDAMVLLDSMGMPPKLQKKASNWSGDLKAGFETFTDPKNDQRFFIPRMWMDTMAGRLGGLVKSGDTYAALNPNPLEASLGRRWGVGLNLWNRSLLTGLIMPIPRYFVAMLAGNIGQVYSVMGAGAAGKFALRSAYDLTDGAVSHIPFFGEKIRAKTLGRFENGLPSAMGTFISPTVSKFFDPTRHKASELLYPAGGGPGVTYGELRKQAIKYGVMTSFVGQSGMQDAAARALRTSKFDKGMAWLTEWTDSWMDMADHIEQRQRVGLYIDEVVNKGMDPKKAGAVVRDSLYDWNHPMSKVEMDYFKRVFMFYTFQRKAMGQAMRHVFSPTMGLHNPMSRDLRLSRTHHGAQTMADQYTEAQYPPDPYNYPWGVKESGQRVYMGKRPMTPSQRQYWNTQQGKDVSHTMFSIPAPSKFESFNQIRTLVSATGQMAHGDFEGAAKSSLDVLGSMTGRVGEAAVGGVKQTAGLAPPRYASKKVGDRYFRAVTNPTDRALLVPLLEVMAPGSVTKDGSKVFISSGAYMAWDTLLPVLSVELASWLDPMMTQEQADHKALYMARQLSGVMKETPYKARVEDD